jgi:phosphoribosylglycinamide formyltransferase 1
LKKVIILTGAEMRHRFFRMSIARAQGFEVVRTYCEGLEQSLSQIVADDGQRSLRRRHVEARERAEEDFFGLFVNSVVDESNPVFIKKGEINSASHTDAIVNSGADLLVSYGCSIIHERLINAFQGRFINVHLGLSPYYRGCGTNFWPLVNGEPEMVGATFMHIDPGVDTGEIIHQIRAKYVWGDTPSTVGNRLIRDMTASYRRIITNFSGLDKLPQPAVPANVRLYRRSDFSEESVEQLYDKFNDGLVEEYLENEAARCAKGPIVRNPVLEGAAA